MVQSVLHVQADGSLHETVGAVDLAAAIGALDEARAEEILALAARMRGMLRGMLRSAMAPAAKRVTGRAA